MDRKEEPRTFKLCAGVLAANFAMQKRVDDREPGNFNCHDCYCGTDIVKLTRLGIVRTYHVAFIRYVASLMT